MGNKNILKIGLIQSSCVEDREVNFKKTLNSIEQLCDAGANIISTQELFSSLYFCQIQNTEFFKWAEEINEKNEHIKVLSKLSRKNKVVIIASLFEKRTEGIYHNTAIVFDADGSIIGLYRKMHIPDDPHFNEKFYFTPGDLGYKVFKTKYAPIGVLICWDQWYPESARITSLMGAKILFYPTAIGWLPSEKKKLGKKQYNSWEIIQRSHAIANGVFVASINRTGYEKFPELNEGIEFWGSSFICDPYGEIIKKAPVNKEALISAEIDLSMIEEKRTIWPFFRDRRIDSYQGILKRFIDEKE
ncbi:MAG: carbon-nitrogen hydrolase [Proteobacteria bacterium]|nr:carbon-nitrogen hydrolase [Pseudomonadota bacterium]